MSGKLLPIYDTYKYYWNAVFWKHSSTLRKFAFGDRLWEWLTDFKTPASNDNMQNSNQNWSNSE